MNPPFRFSYHYQIEAPFSERTRDGDEAANPYFCRPNPKAHLFYGRHLRKTHKKFRPVRPDTAKGHMAISLSRNWKAPLAAAWYSGERK